MKFQWLGLQYFEPIFEKQKQSIHWSSDQEEVWGLEHPLVVTLGRRANINDEVYHRREGMPVVVTDRGGLATLHGPGQLVIYPLISIRRRQWGPREYVCQLLKITQATLLEIGISATVDDSNSGLFVDQKKICFVGLRVVDGRVYHGLSLNVSNDLSEFNSIRSCGLQQRPMTSLMDLGLALSPELVFEKWTQAALVTPLASKETGVAWKSCDLPQIV